MAIADCLVESAPDDIDDFDRDNFLAELRHNKTGIQHQLQLSSPQFKSNVQNIHHGKPLMHCDNSKPLPSPTLTRMRL